VPRQRGQVASRGEDPRVAGRSSPPTRRSQLVLRDRRMPRRAVPVPQGRRLTVRYGPLRVLGWLVQPRQRGVSHLAPRLRAADRGGAAHDRAYGNNALLGREQDDSLAEGIPSILTQEKFELDGETIANPLRSFRVPVALEDATDDGHVYDKPAGYETVRYPLSGLVGTTQAREASEAHNAKYPDTSANTAALNANVKAWMNGPMPSQPRRSSNGTQALFEACLRAPNYTVFSNTTSAAEWNRDHDGTVVSVEAPHNDLHLAVGGFDSKPIVPSTDGSAFEAGLIAESNGDMGENNTAGLDPIFFFHHCNIDRMFWLWQKRHHATAQLEVLDGYARNKRQRRQRADAWCGAWGQA
jgi:hypothetical protein